MQLDWSTLVLEVINFLVLVWLLKHFFYKPVLGVIAQRKAAIDKTLSDAEARDKEAKNLQSTYQGRLEQWEKEKDGLRQDLTREMKAQRQRMTADLDRDLVKERERQDVLMQRRVAQLEGQADEKGRREGLQFTARLLERIASPELEARFVDIFLEDLGHLPKEQQEALRTASRSSHQRIRVTSAFPLTDSQRGTVAGAIKDVVQEEVAAAFQEDAALLGGIRINIGPWTLRANLQDELAFFGERVRDAS